MDEGVQTPPSLQKETGSPWQALRGAVDGRIRGRILFRPRFVEQILVIVRRRNLLAVDRLKSVDGF